MAAPASDDSCPMIHRVVLICSSLLIACGGDDDGAAAIDAPAPPPADARADAPTDAPPDCKLSTADFGDLGARAGGTATFDGGPNPQPQIGLASFYLPLEQDAAPDQLVLQLWSNYPPFGTLQQAGPLVTGTFPLTGPQLQLRDCGVCVTMIGGWAPGTPPPLDAAYMATGGTVTLDTLDAQPGGAFALTLTDVTFEHVTVSNNVSTPVGDGCVTAIDNLVYTGTFAR
jgi:hypothetical protein